MSRRRPRRFPRGAPRARRPIAKELIAVNKDGVAGSQVATTLKTATFPCTVVGLRWDLTLYQDAGTGTASGRWAIILIDDGDSANTLGVTDAGTFYQPENHVMAYGFFSIDNNTRPLSIMGSTKTMRKMQDGDILQFVIVGVATNTVALRGCVQYFCKT